MGSLGDLKWTVNPTCGETQWATHIKTLMQLVE